MPAHQGTAVSEMARVALECFEEVYSAVKEEQTGWLTIEMVMAKPTPADQRFFSATFSFLMQQAGLLVRSMEFTNAELSIRVACPEFMTAAPAASPTTVSSPIVASEDEPCDPEPCNI